MSQTVANLVEERNVVVSLESGPKGSLRLTYESPSFKMPPEWSHQVPASRHFGVAYAASGIELDREKLRKLQFSQAELAEIGFSLVSRLWALAQSMEPRDA
jgi:hypothetical protein